MKNEFSEYFNYVVDSTIRLTDDSLKLESSLFTSQEQIKNYSEYFDKEIVEIKNLLHDITLFINGLSEQFIQLQENSTLLVSKEELEELNSEINKINFGNLILRKTMKEKIFK